MKNRLRTRARWAAALGMLSTACSSDWLRLRRGSVDAAVIDDGSPSDVVAIDVVEDRADAATLPEDASGDAGAVGRRIVSGDGFVCSYTVGARDLRCIGDNTEGQLALGNLDLRSTAQAITGLPAGATIEQVVANARSLCVLGSLAGARRVWCAGSRDELQLGDGPSEVPKRRTEFVEVQGFTAANAPIELASSGATTCAITGPSRSVFCWGRLDYRLAQRPTATALTASGGAAVDGVARLWIGHSTLYVLLANGALLGMGLRDTGLLLNAPGMGGVLSTLTPITNAPPMPGAIDSNAGNACAVSGGQVFCWGSGAGSWSGPIATPTVARLAGGEEAVDVRLGERHACALTRSGAVYCWGNNAFGQLGTMAPRAGSTSPARVTLPSEAAAIDVGFNHSCALLRSGGVHCWGSGAFGQLGHTVARGPADEGRDGTVLALGAHVTCVGSGPELRCFGEHDRWAGTDYRLIGDRVVLRAPSGTINNASVSSQLFTAYLLCATSTDGAAYCAGTPASDFTSMDLPIARQQGVREADSSRRAMTVRNIAVGNAFALAVDAMSSTIYGWGEGRTGVLTTTSSADIAYATALSHAALAAEPLDPIDAGLDFVCGRRTGTGALLCWGYDGHGQSGSGSRTYAQVAPTTIGGLIVAPGRRTISVGTQHLCVVAHTATDPVDALYCWGWNEHFQTALTGDWVIRPSRMGLPAGVVAVAAGASHTCALGAGGVIRCWGDNRFGQLGVGSAGFVTVNNATTVVLPGGEVARDIDAGFRHTCVQTTSNRTYCWGWNGFGQIALPGSTLPFSLVPQLIAGL